MPAHLSSCLNSSDAASQMHAAFDSHTCCRRPYELPIWSEMHTCFPFGRVMKSVEPLAAAPLLLEPEGATVLPMVASMSVCQGWLSFNRRDLLGISGQGQDLGASATTAVAHLIIADLTSGLSVQCGCIKQHQADDDTS